MKKVNYQKNKADQFTHSYKYDAANRLTHVYTSHDNEVHQTLQAHYFYYDYGPLARVEIGKEKVQGMDYAYTINGWIKGMNSSRQLKGNDIGKDGNLTGYNPSNNSIHRNVALDVLAYTVGYFKDDYKPITTAPLANAFEAARYNTTGTPYLFETTAGNLYNGNISSTVISIDGTNNTLGTAYKYDQLQRLKKSTTFEIATTTTQNNWSGITATDNFGTSYSYDKNGNFDKLTRKNNSTSLMDNFSYTYLNIGSAPSNRLGHVSDAVNASANTDDIESQNPNNYGYDQLGQLIGDQQEQIANIEWRSGDKKIKTLTRTSNAGSKSDMEFVYNPIGQRILKIEKTRTANVLDPESSWKYTYYAYDANGQVMATYAVKLSSTVNRATLTEQNIYGASRLGMRRKDVRLYENGTSPYVIPAVQQNTLGNIAYEITNYLGNVNVVISDRKIWTGTPTNAFKACVVSRTDYFPFGMEISSRTTNSDNYRFGYNGMESDNETKGSGNSYTTEFRQYDPRIGRWLSLDPLMAQFPWQSPYCAFDNNPVFFTDPLGLAAEGCEGDPPAGTNRTNPATGTVYTADGNGGWFQNIEEVTVKPQSLNDYTSVAVENNTSNQIKQVSESTNPNIPDYNSILENQKIKTKNRISPGDDLDYINQVVFGEYRKVNGQYYDYNGKPTFPPLTGNPPDIGLSKGTSLLKALFSAASDPKTMLKATKILAKKWPFKKVSASEIIKLNCDKDAIKLQKLIGGKVITISSKFGKNYKLGPVKMGDEFISEWYYHKAVQIGDRVFDRLTGPDGLHIDDYKKLFKYSNDLIFK